MDLPPGNPKDVVDKRSKPRKGMGNRKGQGPGGADSLHRDDIWMDKRKLQAAAGRRLAGVKASGKVNFPPKERGGVKYPPFGVHGRRSTKEV